MASSPDRQPHPSDALHRVELRTDYLIESYIALRDETERLRRDNARLAQELSAKSDQVAEMERKLTLAVHTSGADPDLRRSGRRLYDEVSEMVDLVDEALDLLEMSTR